MTTHETVYIPAEQLKKFNKILQRQSPLPNYGSEEELACVPAHFGDGFTGEVRLLNGPGTPQIRAVLYKDDHEVATSRCYPPFEGTYTLYYCKQAFQITLAPRKFYRAVFKVEVLADAPLGEETLTELQASLAESDLACGVSLTSTREVSARMMAYRLTTQGRDPEFMGLTRSGKDIGDDE